MESVKETWPCHCGSWWDEHEPIWSAPRQCMTYMPMENFHFITWCIGRMTNYGTLHPYKLIARRYETQA